MTAVTSRPAIDLGRLAPALQETCGEYCGSYRDELAAAVRSGEGGVNVSQMHARILDGLLGALFCAADAAARAAGHRGEGRVALVAVGGYGRGLVGLGSDVDVLFLCDDPSDPHVAALAEGLLYPLWDLGLDIGHAVRGVRRDAGAGSGGSAHGHHAARHAAGGWRQEHPRRARPGCAADGLRQRPRALPRPARGGLAGAARERFGGSLYLLEPEVKLGCGGLRDLDVAMWAANARWTARNTDELRAQRGALLSREVDELEHRSRDALARAQPAAPARAGGVRTG